LSRAQNWAEKQAQLSEKFLLGATQIKMFLQKAKTKMKKGGAILFARTFYFVWRVTSLETFL
jgi:hypothetical protein